jgi:hypothetical protein
MKPNVVALAIIGLPNIAIVYINNNHYHKISALLVNIFFPLDALQLLMLFEGICSWKKCPVP